MVKHIVDLRRNLLLNLFLRRMICTSYHSSDLLFSFSLFLMLPIWNFFMFLIQDIRNIDNRWIQPSLFRPFSWVYDLRLHLVKVKRLASYFNFLIRVRPPWSSLWIEPRLCNLPRPFLRLCRIRSYFILLCPGIHLWLIQLSVLPSWVNPPWGSLCNWVIYQLQLLYRLLTRRGIRPWPNLLYMGLGALDSFVFKGVLESSLLYVSWENSEGFLDVYTEVFILDWVVDEKFEVGAHVGCYGKALENLDVAVEHSVFHVVVPTDNGQSILRLKHIWIWWIVQNHQILHVPPHQPQILHKNASIKCAVLSKQPFSANSFRV